MEKLVEVWGEGWRAEFRVERLVVRGEGEGEGEGVSFSWFWREICWT